MSNDRTDGLLVTVINLCILALAMKLYTEFFKEAARGNRDARN